jgi:hypothetical protein
MAKRNEDNHPRTLESQRRARIERLLFTGATLVTTALTLGNVAGPKIPPFVGE